MSYWYCAWECLHIAVDAAISTETSQILRPLSLPPSTLATTSLPDRVGSHTLNHRVTCTSVCTHSHTMYHCDYFQVVLNFTHPHRNMSSHCFLYHLINLPSLNHYPPRLVNSHICTAFTHSSWYSLSCSCHQILMSNINPFHSYHF